MCVQISELVSISIKCGSKCCLRDQIATDAVANISKLSAILKCKRKELCDDESMICLSSKRS